MAPQKAKKKINVQEMTRTFDESVFSQGVFVNFVDRMEALSQVYVSLWK